MLKNFSLSIVAVLLWASSAFSFELNMNKEEIIRFDGQFLLKDLSVGEKMSVSKWRYFCNSKGKLAILDLSPSVDKKRDWSPQFIITRLPSSSALLEILGDSYSGDKFSLSTMIPGHLNMTCDQRKRSLNLPDAKSIIINTVNGFDKLRDYVDQLKKNGHKTDF